MDIVAQVWGCQNFSAFCASALYVFSFTELVAVTTFHIFCNLLFLEFRNHFEPFCNVTEDAAAGHCYSTSPLRINGWRARQCGTPIPVKV